MSSGNGDLVEARCGNALGGEYGSWVQCQRLPATREIIGSLLKGCARLRAHHRIGGREAESGRDISHLPCRNRTYGIRLCAILYPILTLKAVLELLQSLAPLLQLCMFPLNLNALVGH